MSASEQVSSELIETPYQHKITPTLIDPSPCNPFLASGIFSGVRYYGIDLNDATSKSLVQNGAHRDIVLSGKTTHVIAGLQIESSNAEIAQAIELFDKTVVFEDWVSWCLQYQSVLPLDPFKVQRSRIFKGLCFCLSKLSLKDKHSLAFLVTVNGGNCRMKLTASCTHLVTGCSEGAKYDKAYSTPSIAVVTPDWITGCIESQKLLDVTEYHPSKLVSSAESGYLCAIDSVLTGASVGMQSVQMESMINSDISKELTGKSSAETKPPRPPMLKDAQGRFMKVQPDIRFFHNGKGQAPTLNKKKVIKKESTPIALGGPFEMIANGTIEPKFYGHDPEQNIPPECCLIGCRFLIVEYEQMFAPQEIETWKKVIENYHGTICSTYNAKMTHVICSSQTTKAFKRGLVEGKRVVTAYWLNSVLDKKCHFAPNEAIHFPPAFMPSKSPVQGRFMTICGFPRKEREKLKIMLFILGVHYSNQLSQNTFCVISRSASNEIMIRARENGLASYNVRWLTDLILRGRYAIELSSSVIYQNYETEDPFAIDVLQYPELNKFMGAWVKPLKVNPPEIRKRSLYWEYLQLKQKQSNDPNGQPMKKIRQVSEGANREFILFSPSRTPDQMPQVVFTGIEADQVNRLKVKLFSLGGSMATSMLDCTHVVAPAILRTVKFLMGVSLAPFIVSPNWIEESFEKRWWQDEYDYIVSDLAVEQQLGFRLRASLKRAGDKKLLKGIRVYLTPGVEPDFNTMQLIVEAAGGKMLRREPESSMLGNCRCIIIASEKDLLMCTKYSGKNIGVYSPELILNGVLIQELDFDKYTLDAHSAK